MTEVQFLFNTELVASLENLIKNAKNKLVLISPFIDLSKEIRTALNEHKQKHDFQLLVLFGKNENNLYKSIKKDSFDFLKQFPNVEIRYNERLHAKFYQNDFDFIMTSLNLYDYSLANNIEVGITCNYAAKGFLGAVLNGTDTLLVQGVDKVKHDFLGFTNKEKNPIEEFQKIFEASELKYKSVPIVADKSGFRGVLGGKNLNGSNVIIDNLSSIPQEVRMPKSEYISTNSAAAIKPIYETRVPCKNTTANKLSKVLNVSSAEIFNLMHKSGLLYNNKITDIGISKGLVMKSYMGNDYIEFPENLIELDSLKN